MQPVAALANPSASDVCNEVIQAWRKAHGLEATFEEESHRVILRANSWIAPTSVAAGVMDIFLASPVVPRLSREVIMDLGDKLGIRLREEGLLMAQPRRAGTLS